MPLSDRQIDIIMLHVYLMKSHITIAIHRLKQCKLGQKRKLQLWCSCRHNNYFLEFQQCLSLTAATKFAAAIHRFIFTVCAGGGPAEGDKPAVAEEDRGAII